MELEGILERHHLFSVKNLIRRADTRILKRHTRILCPQREAQRAAACRKRDGNVRLHTNVRALSELHSVPMVRGQ